MANWLNDFVNQHKNLESPESFWKWAALAAISAVIKDNVWMDRQIFNTYPNIYVMFHADSGLKKGPPVAAAKQMVAKVNNTRIIGGRSSIQGILKKLGTGETKKGGQIINKSVAFICSSELSSSIVEDRVATKILTDLYDRSYNPGEWQSLLKMEEFTLIDPTVTMLTATNEAMSEDFFTRSAIQGGYFARTFIVYEKSGIIDNSLIFPMQNKPDYNLSSSYLKELAKLKGEFHPLAQWEKNDEYKYKREKFGHDVYFNATGVLYDDWYGQFKKNIRETDSKDETGTMNRFGDSVLKVAMLLALADAPMLVINEESMDSAIKECEKLLGNVRKTTMGRNGIASTSQLKIMIINELLWREPHEMSRSLMMRFLINHYNSIPEFDDSIDSFIQSGLLVQIMNGNQIIYKMPDNQVTQLTRYMQGKGRIQ